MIGYLLINGATFLIAVVITMTILQALGNAKEDLNELYEILEELENKNKEDEQMISIIPTIEDYIEAYEAYGETVVINDGKVVCTVEGNNGREQ